MRWSRFLQLVGDALRAAVVRGAPGAVDLARACAAALRARGWAGDDILAGSLEAAADGRTGTQPRA